jgi:hypothetical protein
VVSICLQCKTEIPFGACQQGQLIDGRWHALHIGCADIWFGEELPLFRITFPAGKGTGYVAENLDGLNDLESEHADDVYGVQRIYMKRGEFLRLPDFPGF